MSAAVTSVAGIGFAPTCASASKIARKLNMALSFQNGVSQHWPSLVSRDEYQPRASFLQARGPVEDDGDWVGGVVGQIHVEEKSLAISRYIVFLPSADVYRSSVQSTGLK